MAWQAPRGPGVETWGAHTSTACRSSRKAQVAALHLSAAGRRTAQVVGRELEARMEWDAAQKRWAARVDSLGLGRSRAGWRNRLRRTSPLDPREPASGQAAPVAAPYGEADRGERASDLHEQPAREVLHVGQLRGSACNSSSEHARRRKGFAAPCGVSVNCVVRGAVIGTGARRASGRAG